MLRITFLRFGRIVSFLLLLLSAPSLWAQKFALTDVQASRVGGLAVPGAKRALLFYAERARRDSTILRQYWLDEQVRVRHVMPLVLRGPYILQSLTRSRQHVLYQFKRRGYDTLVSVVVDTLGRTVGRFRGRLPVSPPRGTQYHSLDMPAANGFALVEPAPRRSCRVVYRTPDMRLAWDRSFEPRTDIVGSEADSTHLWLITMTNGLSRHPKSQAICLDLRTGQELGRVGIGPAGSSWVPAAMHVGPGHELVLAGYAFDRAASRNRTGDLFYQRFTPAGQPLGQRRITLGRTEDLRSARRGRVHWALVQPDAQGNVRLVGETFQSSSYGAVLLRSSLSFGLLQYSVLRPHDVISLTVDTAGQVHDVRNTPLVHDRGSFVWPGYVPGRILADIAAQYLTFRLRGAAGPAGSMLVLRSPQQVQTLNLTTQQLTPVRQKPAVGEVDVWHVAPDFMLIYQQDAGRRTLEVERVAIDNSVSTEKASNQK